MLSPAVQKTDSDLMQRLNWKELEKTAAFPEVNDDTKVLHIPGGGITKLLFTERLVRQPWSNIGHDCTNILKFLYLITVFCF